MAPPKIEGDATGQSVENEELSAMLNQAAAAVQGSSTEARSDTGARSSPAPEGQSRNAATSEARQQCDTMLSIT